MTFYDGQEENKNIIKSYFANNQYIGVNYLFDDRPATFQYTKEKESEIINQMMEQALKRDEELFNYTKQLIKIYFAETLLSLLSMIFCLKGNLQFLLCISFIAGLISTLKFSENYEKYKEMKKFRLFNSIKEELEKTENKDITKIIEFEPLYRDPINIGTLDNFTYRDVKAIKKELKKNNICGDFEKV